MNKFVFDLQLFADEELTIDQAVEMMNGVQPEVTKEVETVTTETEQAQEVEEVVEVEHETVEQAEVAEQPTIDYNLKIKFKDNGQDQELTVAQLIDRAQKGNNYERHMQELAAQRKAFDLSLQQQQQAVQIDPAKQFEDLNNKVTARAMKMIGLENPDEFVPDATGMLGSKVHYAAYQKAMLDEQQEQQQANYQAEQERFIEDTYVATTRSLQAEPDFLEVNKYAEQALFQLPTKGADGVKQFQTLYATYQKIIQRDQHWNEMQAYGRSNIKPAPFTANEVKALTDFYNDCKAEFNGSKTKAEVKEQVKAQVPKSVPIKPTVKVMDTGHSDSTPAKRIDLNKVREMDLDQVAKLLG